MGVVTDAEHTVQVRALTDNPGIAIIPAVHALKRFRVAANTRAALADSVNPDSAVAHATNATRCLAATPHTNTVLRVAANTRPRLAHTMNPDAAIAHAAYATRCLSTQTPTPVCDVPIMLSTRADAADPVAVRVMPALNCRNRSGIRVTFDRCHSVLLLSLKDE